MRDPSIKSIEIMQNQQVGVENSFAMKSSIFNSAFAFGPPKQLAMCRFVNMSCSTDKVCV